MNIFNQKFDLINQIELENQCNKEEIKNLKEKNEQLKKEQEAMNRTNEIKNQIKYSQLKKRMVENLNETKRNVTNAVNNALNIRARVLTTLISPSNKAGLKKIIYPSHICL